MPTVMEPILSLDRSAPIDRGESPGSPGPGVLSRAARIGLVGLLSAAVLFGGLGLALGPDGAIPTGAQLLSMLPTSVGDYELERGAMSDSLSGGLAFDDAVASLGRTRDDVSAAGGASARGELVVVAFAVSGVSGERLESAVLTNWSGMIPGAPQTIAGKRVFVLTDQGPDRAYIYRRALVVFVVETADPDLAAKTLAALP